MTRSVLDRDEGPDAPLGGRPRHLDFTRPFLPESLAQAEVLDFLRPVERLALNQIRGQSHLALLTMAEDFIPCVVLDHALARLDLGDPMVRSLLGFAGEGPLRIRSFQAFQAEFARGFGAGCGVIGPVEAVAHRVLGHNPLSVALVVLHVALVAAEQHRASVRDDWRLDPHFKRLLGQHWSEDGRHLPLATTVVRALARGRSLDDVEAAVDGYLGLGIFLDKGLEQQVALDLASLERAIERTLAPDERRAFVRVQHQAYRSCFLGSSLVHPRALALLPVLGASVRRAIHDGAPSFAEPVVNGAATESAQQD